jgi:hypothetical protein
MSRSARVTSIGVLQTLATALQRLRGEAAVAMDDLQIETQRALGWIHHDRKDHWARELRRSEEAVSLARVQLMQARTMRRVADQEPACTDEKRALERAKRRHETARQKVDAVQHWTRSIETAVDDVQRNRIRFLGWLDSDLAQAVAALNRMSESLETYVSIEAPTDPRAPIFATGAFLPDAAGDSASDPSKGDFEQRVSDKEDAP